MPKRFLTALAALAVTTAATVAVAAEPAAKAPKQTPESLAQGKVVYATFCVACHGEKGDGAGPAGLALPQKPRNFATEPFKQGSKVEEIFATIGTGVPGTTMVAFPMIPEADRWALSQYVATFVPKAPAKGKK